MPSHTVFITGGTGYLGRPLVRQLLERGHRVRALARAGSERKLPAGCVPVIGDALEPASYAPAEVLVHLVGEALIRASGLDATFVRPWYALSPAIRAA